MFAGVYSTLKPWLFSQDWTAPTCACDGANCCRNWAGVRNFRYEGLLGSETAEASACTAESLFQPR